MFKSQLSRSANHKVQVVRRKKEDYFMSLLQSKIHVYPGDLGSLFSSLTSIWGLFKFNLSKVNFALWPDKIDLLILTDLHMKVMQKWGFLIYGSPMTFQLLTRQWIDVICVKITCHSFKYDNSSSVLHQSLSRLRKLYSFVTYNDVFLINLPTITY